MFVKTIFQARCELIMVRRIINIIIFLATISLPYCIFVFMSFLTNLSKYHYRISLFLLILDRPLLRLLFSFFTTSDECLTKVQTSFQKHRLANNYMSFWNKLSLYRTKRYDFLWYDSYILYGSSARFNRISYFISI